MTTATKKKGTIVTYDSDGNPIEIYPKMNTDTTLSQTNVAADAYEVGARISEINNSIDEKFTEASTSLNEAKESLQNGINGNTTTMEEIRAEIKKEIAAINSKIYPVGSIYISVSNTDPTTIFGGTWEQIKDRFLLTAGDTYKSGSTGGEANHTLTKDEMPSHNHTGLDIDGVYVFGWDSGSVKGVDFYKQFASGLGASTGNRIETGYTGGGKAHNNMPPYLTVYAWKRTA